VKPACHWRFLFLSARVIGPCRFSSPTRFSSGALASCSFSSRSGVLVRSAGFSLLHSIFLCRPSPCCAEVHHPGTLSARSSSGHPRGFSLCWVQAMSFNPTAASFCSSIKASLPGAGLSSRFFSPSYPQLSWLISLLLEISVTWEECARPIGLAQRSHASPRLRLSYSQILIFARVCVVCCRISSRYYS
jgi:hypothetical protein